ncbi:MAG: gluconokinase [Vicinamibacterales bacterium]
MTRVLAIDIGTSSVRATIYGQSLAPVRQGTQVRYRWRTGVDGSVEAAPAAMERVVGQAIDSALDGVTARIDAVALAAFWHSLVGVDASGRPVTAVLPWSDARSAGEVGALRQQLDERAVHARTGCRLHQTYWPARLRWFARHERQIFRRAQRWMSFPTYLQRRWLGRDAESVSQASGSGMFLHATTSWDAELCAACSVSPEQLGGLIDLDDQGAEPTAAVARRWPQLRGARWIPAAADGALDNVGAGCTTGGRAAIMIGTSGALRKLWSTDAAPPVPFGLWRYWLDRRRVVVGGASSNGGNLAAWMRQTLGLEHDKRLEARIARMPPDSHHLTMLPFVAGERSPDYLPDARGALAGFRLATTRDDIFRAGLEAVAYRFLEMQEELVTVSPVTRLVATGTALTSSRLWPQILADVLGHQIALPRATELTSRGAAIIGFEQLGVPLPRPEPAIARVFHPDPRSHAVYRAAAARQQQLLRAVLT